MIFASIKFESTPEKADGKQKCCEDGRYPVPLCSGKDFQHGRIRVRIFAVIPGHRTHIVFVFVLHQLQSQRGAFLGGRRFGRLDFAALVPKAT